MLYYVGIADVRGNGQVYRVRQEHFFEFFHDFVLNVQRQIRAAAQGQVYIRAILVISFSEPFSTNFVNWLSALEKCLKR